MIVPPSPLRTAVSTLLFFAGLALAPPGLHAQVHWENDVRMSYEYDDNVREEIVDAVQARIARISLKSDLLWDDSTTNQLSLMYQGGFKRYFDVHSDSLGISNQFINEGTVVYRHQISRNQLELSGGVKNRAWQDNGFFFVNEDGFTRPWAGLAARRTFSPTWSGEISGRLSGIHFRHVDEFFGYNAQMGRLGVTKQLSPGVVADFFYTLEQRTYDGRAKLFGPDDDPANISAPDRPRQVDLAHDAGVGFSFLEAFGLQAGYRYHLNNSNSFGFDYSSQIFNLQLAQQLPWRMIAQFYGSVELRKFKDPVRGLAGTLDVGDTDNNVLVFRLLKEINGHFDVEGRYARYRNESINLNALYTKNVYSLGFRVRP